MHDENIKTFYLLYDSIVSLRAIGRKVSRFLAIRPRRWCPVWRFCRALLPPRESHVFSWLSPVTITNVGCKFNFFNPFNRSTRGNTISSPCDTGNRRFGQTLNDSPHLRGLCSSPRTRVVLSQLREIVPVHRWILQGRHHLEVILVFFPRLRPQDRLPGRRRIWSREARNHAAYVINVKSPWCRVGATLSRLVRWIRYFGHLETLICPSFSTSRACYSTRLDAHTFNGRCLMERARTRMLNLERKRIISERT